MERRELCRGFVAGSWMEEDLGVERLSRVGLMFFKSGSIAKAPKRRVLKVQAEGVAAESEDGN